jgi:hypothetical protein
MTRTVRVTIVDDHPRVVGDLAAPRGRGRGRSCLGALLAAGSTLAAGRVDEISGRWYKRLLPDAAPVSP